MIGNSKESKLLLQARDRHLLKEAAILKVFDRKQAQIFAGFRSESRANVRLPKLVSAGLLHRYFFASEKGGKKSIYSLSKKGALLAGVSFSGIKRSKDKLLVGDLFINHQMHINEIYLQVKYKLPEALPFKFKRWLVPKLPLSGASRIIPDAYFQIESTAKQTSSFLECDLGGESSKVWRQKIEEYLAFATTGEFQKHFRETQFRVVVVTTTERRMQALANLIARYTDKIFWLSTFELINLSGFWSSVWRRPKADQFQPFI